MTSELVTARKAALWQTLKNAFRARAKLVVLTDVDAGAARQWGWPVCGCSERRQAHLHVAGWPWR